MKKIKIGFAGVGFMGQKAHLANYIDLDDCEVTALAEPRIEMGKKVAAHYGIREVYNSHTELLKNAEVDAIVASQRYGNHINLIPDILNAGIPVFTEKPIAISPENGKILADLADAKKVLYMVGYHKRSDPAMEYAIKVIREWKSSGEFGKMKLVRITMPAGDWLGGISRKIVSTDENYPPIVLEPLPSYFTEETGKKYNSFVNYYIHQINAMRFLLGEDYKVTYADKSGVLLAAVSESGVCGTIEMSPYTNSTDWQEECLIAFEKGFVKVELPAPLAINLPGKVTVMKDNRIDSPSYIQPILPKVHAMKNQAANFIKAVRGEKEAPCTAREAVKDLVSAREYIELLEK